MLQFSKEDKAKLYEALKSGYKKYNSLKLFVDYEEFPFTLNDIAESRALRTARQNLIDAIEEEGLELNLVLALYKDRPKNRYVQRFVQRFRDCIKNNLLLEPETIDSDDEEFEIPSELSGLEYEAFLPEPASVDINVAKLQRGLGLINSVCRVAFTSHDEVGTGFLVAPNLIITNYHVLSKDSKDSKEQLAENAKNILFEFGYISEKQSDPITPDTFWIDQSDPILSYSPKSELDYVLLRVEDKISEEKFKHIKPVEIAKNLDVKTQEALYLLQHPRGNVMQLSLSGSGVVKVNEGRDRLWYVNRTHQGSSGSPCFNKNWELVALHHASMSRAFGSIREGILFSSIYSKISQYL